MAATRKKSAGKRTPAKKSSSGRTSSGRSSSGRSSSRKTTSRSSSSRTSSASKRSGGSKVTDISRARGGRSSGVLARDILICVVLAACILLFLSYLGLGGRYGRMAGDTFFGLFGLMAYILPFAVFFGFMFFISNSSNPLVLRKILGFVMLFIFMAVFVQLLTLGYIKDASWYDLYDISLRDRTGGGAVGGIITSFFGYAFGTVGAYVLAIIFLVISAIIMTQKPLISSAGRKGRNAARNAREESMRKREIRRELDEEEEMSARQERIRRIEKEAALREKEEAQREKEAARNKRSSLSDEEIPSKKRDTSRRTAAASIADDPLEASTLTRPEPREVPVFTINGRPVTETAAEPDEAVSREAASSFAMPEFLKGNGREESAETHEAAPFVPAGDDLFKEDPAEVSAFSDITDEAEMPGAETLDETAAEIHEGRATSGAAPEAASGARSASAPKKDIGSVSVEEIVSEIESAPVKPVYKLPPVTLLKKGKAVKKGSDKQLMNTAEKLQQTLHDFGVNARVVNVSRGPTVTRYELQPDQGVKVSKILNLEDDIMLNLAARELRIEAPIPGKAAVGIEVPNNDVSPVLFRDLIESPEFQSSKAALAFAVGQDIGGSNVIADIEKMPHLLIAGATGAGKSVCIHTLIMSVLYKSTPDEVRMIMIDPKVVELKVYDGIPHLLIPVVTDPKKAAGALNWAVAEMMERYRRFSEYPGVTNIKAYNTRVEKANATLPEEDRLEPMPRILIVVDELADLMMVASQEVESAICRLAQLARAAGIHLVIATQRPSVNVVTGLIKANMPSRIALAVNSGVDSRTILDMNGAEKLLGKGDMLYYPQNYPKPARLQGAFISDAEILEVVKFLTSQSEDVGYNMDVEEKISMSATSFGGGASSSDDERDEYFAESGRLIIEKDKASIGMLQRAFKIGFNRAARIMDQLAEAGVVGGEEGTKPRKILLTLDEFNEMLSNS